MFNLFYYFLYIMEQKNVYVLHPVHETFKSIPVNSDFRLTLTGKLTG